MPPRVVQQTAQTPPTSSRSLPKGADGVNAWDLIDTIHMLLYGESGSGKTTLAATFPGPILWLISSGGKKSGELKSVNTPEYRKKIKPYILQSSDELKVRLEEAKDYATVVFDHVSGLCDLILKEVLGLDEIPVQKSWGLAQQDQWGIMGIQAKEYLRHGLNLPGNVVIIGQERTFNGKEDGASDILRPVVGADVIPSLARWLNPACDYVVQTFKRPRMNKHTQKVAGKDVTTLTRGEGVDYCLRTGPHDVYMTKFRVPKGTPLPEYIVDPTYDKILALIQGKGTTGKK